MMMMMMRTLFLKGLYCRQRCEVVKTATSLVALSHSMAPSSFPFCVGMLAKIPDKSLRFKSLEANDDDEKVGVEKKISIQKVLEQVSKEHMSVQDALKRIQALKATEVFENVGGFAHIDHERRRRTGMPEVIYGEGKTPEQICTIFRSLLCHKDSDTDTTEQITNTATNADSTGARVIMATRVSQELFEKVQELEPNLLMQYNDVARICTVNLEGEIAAGHKSSDPSTRDQKKGFVVVVCAGTTDLPVAEEAAVTAAAFGAEVDRVYDVGVAGIHRLLGNLDRISEADVVICVAGMDGALPSVVGGLVEAPVIAVPTSVGYGAAFNGTAPLLTMLNSCASGVCVMNIDNGFGAATVATKILRKFKKC